MNPTGLPVAFVAGDTSAISSNSQKNPNKKSHNKAVIIFFLVLLFLALDGAISYYFFFVKSSSQVTKESLADTNGIANVPTNFPTPAKISPQPTTSPNSTVNWYAYANVTYGFTVKYPPNFTLTFNKLATNSAEPYLVTIADPTSATSSGKFIIEVQDPKYVGQSDIESRTIMTYPLSQFVTTKWTKNNSEATTTKIVGFIKESTVNNKQAFSFTLTGDYHDDRQLITLNSENTFYFTDNGSYKFMIAYPTNSKTFNNIFGTFEFTK